MSKVFIEDLEEKQAVQTVFYVREKNLLKGKTGKSYLSVSLADRTGQIDARVWENVEKMTESFQVDDFVSVKGFVQSFQNRKQLVIHQLEAVDPSEVDIADFVATSKGDVAAQFEELKTLVVENVDNKYLSELIFSVLDDPQIQPLFLKCPAAKSVHHAYLGGLVEHTLSIAKIMVLLGKHYSFLDMNLLVTGAVFHDIGKLWELNYTTGLGYSDVGRLLGHLTLGSELIEKKASEIPNFPYDLKTQVKHLILSHHGQLEFGSPKRPKFLEAVALNFIDDLDSKLNAMLTFMSEEKKSGERWTRYHQMYDRYFFLDALKEKLGDSDGSDPKAD